MKYFTEGHLLSLMTHAPNCQWRFDVDLSLEAAGKMARFAQLAGVSGTFYLMTRSEFYNPFSSVGEATIGTIVRTGHQIGLHCEYRSGDVAVAVRRDLELFTAAYQLPLVNTPVSFHMPPRSVLWQDFDGFENAYGSRWQGQYVSDARREWDEIKERRVMAHGNELQVALHAEHWFGFADKVGAP